jgi:ABC-type dipeptide/oligopeptide/nickel transport system permease component
MGLDAPLPVRYLRFLAGVVTRGDLGQSLISGRPVAGLVIERFAYTVELALLAVLGALVVGLAAGLAAAARPGGRLDFVLMAVTGLGISLPVYWVALLLMLVFSLRLHWLPAVGAGSPAHLVLPAVTLALPTAAAIARLVRANVLDVRGADYVRTAAAKGLPASALWRRHVLRNGLIPVVSMLGLYLGHLLGGTFIVETLYAWPGLGRLAVEAIETVDVPLILGTVIVTSLIVVVSGILIDVVQCLVDPRIRQNWQ